MRKGKQLLALSGIVSLMIGVAPLMAASKGQPTWSLPSDAVHVDTDVLYLGKKIDPQSHRLVEGYAFVHRADAVKANARNGGPNSCYTYLASGAKWKGAPEPWVMNPANIDSLNGTSLFSSEGADLAKWEDAADGTVGNSGGVDIMGNGSQTSATLTADSSAPDGNNEVYFADIAQNGVIAVTTVWGIFGGPVQNRVLSEWDQVFDDVSFNWSLSGEANKMDFNNIATHELGHAVGMGHPSNTCTEETMYAYANYGETKKQTLNTGDINGINQLY